MSYKKIAVWLWKSSQGFRGLICISSLASALRIACMLAFVYFSKRVIDTATGHTISNLWVEASLMGSSIAAEILLGILVSYLEKTMEVRMQNRLRQNTFRALLAAEWRALEHYHSGDIVNRLEQDVKDVTTLITSTLPRFVSTSLQFLASFAFLYLLDHRLALAMVVIMPLFVLASKAYMRKMRKITHNIRKSDSKIQSVLQESLQHRTVIKALDQSEPLSGQLELMQDELHHQVQERTRFAMFSKGMISAGFASGYFTAFVWGAVQLSHGNISFGVMTAFLQLVGQVQRPVLETTQMVPTLISAITATERLYELEALPKEPSEMPVLLDRCAGIRLANINFGYTHERNVFSNFTFDFKPGSSTAIIGETGAGKTTIIRLLLSFISPRQGTITLYDNSGFEHPATAATRRNFIYVPQGNTLFSGTIRDNLKLGNPDATEEEMHNVLEAAAADFVFDLPNGIDTICGEQGGGLSEGQAQRIAIARSLLRSGSIVLLDEATSALDPQTEAILIARLKERTSGKTLIFITHRLSLIGKCDNVLNLTSNRTETFITKG